MQSPLDNYLHASTLSHMKCFVLTLSVGVLVAVVAVVCVVGLTGITKTE